MNILGIDIGGTTIKGGIVNNDKIINYSIKPTNIKDGIDGFYSTLFSIISELIDYSDKETTIGLSSTGDINPISGKVIYATDSMPGFTGVNLKKIIEAKFNRKVTVLNDSLSALVGEFAYGAAQGTNNVVMLTLGTGVGGGVISNGKLLLGSQYRASRLGHTTLYKEGRLCSCGKRGCIEAYVSAGGLLKSAQIIGRKFDDVRDIFQTHDRELINDVVDVFTNDLASVIENYIAIFDPQKVIIGGGLILTSEHWWEELMTKINSNVEIVPAQLGNDSGIIGAAYLTVHEMIEGV